MLIILTTGLFLLLQHVQGILPPQQRSAYDSNSNHNSSTSHQYSTFNPFKAADPLCFDCHLSMYPCMNFAQCSNASGQCVCPPGFGGSDCSLVACGSPAMEIRPLRPEGVQSCKCEDGWTGLNCNVCSKDSVCDGFNPTGLNGTCYNNLLPVKQNSLNCDVKNPAILALLKEKKPELTIGCNRDSAKCNFQFWAGEVESFFCDLDQCDFKEDFQIQKNVTNVKCNKLQCKCFPGRLLCGEGGSLDLTEWFESEEGPVGPGEFNCEESVGTDAWERNCVFTESNMNQLISQFFGDPFIKLSCKVAGECMHYTQVPGYTRPDFRQGFPIVVIFILSGLGVFLLLGALYALSYFRKRAENAGYTPLSTEDAADELQRRRDLMDHHVPCTIMFQSTNYDIETKKKIVPSPQSGDAVNHQDPHSQSGQVNSNGSPTFKQVVLEGIQGTLKHGEVMAIMGGSGAGKTTLLDILARKNKSGIVSGDILVNGVYMDYEKYRNIIGYVDQEDTLMDTLTVYETVMYSALLRLPRIMSLAAKERRVQETMKELGIIGIANKRIGSSGNRGLSGGEKRRVSIACELVTSPSILFLDEPTSGLDSYNAYNVIECLVGLARDYQRSVIFTIHQPRSNIYALFDHLILLSKGRLVYSGPAQQPAIEHFARLGFECPLGFNIADYLVDLTMHAATSSISSLPSQSSRGIAEEGDPAKVSIRTQQENLLYSPKSPMHAGKGSPSNKSARPIDPDLIVDGGQPIQVPGQSQPMTIVQGQSIKAYLSDELSALIRGYEASPISKKIRSDIRAALNTSYPEASPTDIESLRQRSRRKNTFPQEGQATIASTINSLTAIFVESNGRSGANWLDQFKILSGRTFKNLYRNPDLLRTHYAISIIVAVICGLLFWQVDDTLAGFQNRLGVMFFVCALFGFGCLSSMQAFASERLIFVRERANRYYAPITYFSSKIFFDIIPLRVVPPVILGMICYHMIGLQPEIFMLFRFLLVLVLFNVTSASCCLAISIIFNDQGVASLVATLVMLFEMLFGGLLLNKATMPPSFQWMQNLSFFNYAFEALVVNEVVGLTLVEEKFGFKIDVPGALILQTFGLNAQGFWGDVQALGIMCSIFLSVAFLWLQFAVKERR